MQIKKGIDIVTINKTYNADSISVLDGLEPVRKRPGMYIGSTGTRGLHHLVYEIVDNSVDEHLAGFCDRIDVVLYPDDSCSVADNGRGIPVDLHKKGMPAARLILTTLHSGGKFDNSSYKTSGGLHGVGSAVVNALSEWLELEVHQNKKISTDRYEKGKPVKKLKRGELLPIKGSTQKTGSLIRFKPDAEIFSVTEFKAEDIKEHLHEMAYLNPGLTLSFQDLRSDEQEEVLFYEPEGIKCFIADLNKNRDTMSEIVHFSGKDEGIEVTCAIQYSDEFHETILGFCNNIYNSEGGTHLTGFKTALTSLLNQYARHVGILKERDENFTGTDIRNGLSAVISIRHPDPRFEGQTKTKLDNPDANRAVMKVVNEQLTLYFDRNLEELRLILGNAEKSANLRKQKDRVQQNMLGKKKAIFASNGKFSGCESTNPAECEVFLVEGDSAGGTAKSGRNRRTQAIMPLRGKILNVEKAEIDRILANAEIKSMINAFGCGFSEGFGDDFDINKLKYDKIIIMTDADVDGSHIATLLLTFFYRYMPELIHEGHVYLAMPPLYKVIAKNKETYLYNDRALAEYRKTNKNFKLRRYKGLGEMNEAQLWETTMNPETRVLKRVYIEDARRASDVTSVLMGSKVAPRKEFIMKNAEEAKLDV